MHFQITICIITFNRGFRALESVNYLIPRLKKNWGILVLDNNSDVQVDEYNKIKDISKQNSQVNYIKHDQNKMFHGNFRSCFDYAKSKYVMIISDEDFVNCEGLYEQLARINKKNNLAACRPSINPFHDLKIPRSLYNYEDIELSAGDNALNNFSFANNYISGIIYNLELIKKTKILEMLDKNMAAHRNYPHLYLDILVASKFNVAYSSISCVYERHNEPTLIENGTTSVTKEHIGLYGYGERINQFFAFRDAIFDAIDLLENVSEIEKINIFVNLYFKLVRKYYYLIFNATASRFFKNNIDVYILKESFHYIACSAILKYDFLESFQEKVLDELTKIYKESIVRDK